MSSGGGPVNVLLIGGGGREHALAWRLKQSPRLGRLFVTDPQNPGLAELGTPVDVPVDFRQPFRLQRFCDKNSIGLVVIGPEDPLALGLADALAAPGRVVFGPSAAAARLEADKAWCKQLIRNASVPTAESRIFTDPEAARFYVESRVLADEPALSKLVEASRTIRDSSDRRRFMSQQIAADPALAAVYAKRHDDLPVIKASGLAKGKGVVLPSTLGEALDAIERIMVKLEFDEAGRTVVIEERLEGSEVSVLCLVDGRNIYVLEPCQDHKRLGDGDTGPNTGGMGVICPGGIMGQGDDSLLNQIQAEIIVPTVDAMRREGIEFRGVLYAGVMLTPAGPKLLEFNVRFGDPECQALMVRLESDILDLMLATGTRTLDEADMRWSTDRVCCIVLASGGYPGRYKTGVPIGGLDAAGKVPGVVVFHAGTKRDNEGRVVTSGGRVLNVVGRGVSMAEARRAAYQAADLINFEGKTLRRDIGAAAG
ncbi:MAG: phosphoribosylamine--glycine ligase [Phycisphaerales bacterium]|nr:phosphoribosylamine--glycine ligase [Phycisphaerales bacterium]